MMVAPGIAASVAARFATTPGGKPSGRLGRLPPGSRRQVCTATASGAEPGPKCIRVELVSGASSPKSNIAKPATYRRLGQFKLDLDETNVDV
jgi:hypothetical protein